MTRPTFVGLVIGLLLAAMVSLPKANAAGGALSSQSMSARTTTVTVPRSTPSLTQVASAGGPAGTTEVTDQVTLSGGTTDATGTVTFRLWSDSSCLVPFGSASVVAVSGANGSVVTSGSLTPTSTGTFRWTAWYSGDADNEPASTACGAVGSTVDITPALLAFSTIGSPTVATSNITSTVAYPAGTVANDLLFLIEINAFGGASTTPTGWTQLVNQSTNTPAKLTLRVWTRLSGGESSVSLAFKSGAAGSTAWVVRYTRSSGYPPNPASATATVQSGLTGATASLIPSSDVVTTLSDARVITFAVVRAANSLSLSTPRSFVSRTGVTSSPAGGAPVALAIADRLVGSVGTAPSPTWTQSGTAAQWAWATVAWK